MYENSIDIFKILVAPIIALFHLVADFMYVLRGSEYVEQTRKYNHR